MKPKLDQELQKKKYYAGAAFSALLIVLLGFGRSYYLKLFFATPALTSLLHLHGIVMTSWLLLFALQVYLVAIRRVDLHRRLGKAGFILAIIVLMMGVATALVATQRDMLVDPGALAFLTNPLGDLLVFSVLVGFGFGYRRQRDFHSRLMLLANLSILTPAIARIPLEFISHGGAWLVFALNDLCVAIFILYDAKQRGRLHAAFGWGGLLIVLAQPLRLLIGEWQVWLNFAGRVLGH